MTPSQKRKLAVIDRETDALAARLKWARAAQRAGKHGIGDLVPPPGGWPSAHSTQRPRDTAPALTATGRPVAYRAPASRSAGSSRSNQPVALAPWAWKLAATTLAKGSATATAELIADTRRELGLGPAPAKRAFAVRARLVR